MNKPRLTEKLSATLAALALTAGLGLAGAPPASAAYCGITWGSATKMSQVSNSSSVVTNVRSGRHDCFDRLVIDVQGPIVGYHVAYVPEYTGIGSGLPIPLRGGADISVTVFAPASRDGKATYSPTNRMEIVNVGGYSTFRQVVLSGSVGGHTGIGLGVRARLPMRVFVVPGPGTASRMVVDVAHFW